MCSAVLQTAALLDAKADAAERREEGAGAGGSAEAIGVSGRIEKLYENWVLEARGKPLPPLVTRIPHWHRNALLLR